MHVQSLHDSKNTFSRNKISSILVAFSIVSRQRNARLPRLMYHCVRRWIGIVANWKSIIFCIRLILSDPVTFIYANYASHICSHKFVSHYIIRAWFFYHAHLTFTFELRHSHWHSHFDLQSSTPWIFNYGSFPTHGVPCWPLNKLHWVTPWLRRLMQLSYEKCKPHSSQESVKRTHCLRLNRELPSGNSQP